MLKMYIEINGLTDSEGNSIVKTKESNDGILTFIYNRNASFTFSYHLTRILGIREQTYKITELIDDPNRTAENTMPNDRQKSSNRTTLQTFSQQKLQVSTVFVFSL